MSLTKVPFAQRQFAKRIMAATHVRPIFMPRDQFDILLHRKLLDVARGDILSDADDLMAIGEIGRVGALELLMKIGLVLTELDQDEMMTKLASLRKTQTFRDGEPCGHPGCLSHVSHPCENCGRIGGYNVIGPDQARLAARLDRAKPMHDLAHTWYALSVACRHIGAMIERAAKEMLHESTNNSVSENNNDDNTN